MGWWNYQSIIFAVLSCGTVDYIINIGKHLKNILILEESFLQITIDLYMIRPKIHIWLATKIVDYILAKNSGQAAFTLEKLLN